MAYFIFLKYLDSLEDFRKNPHVKIPPKSPCANFQSIGIFKNPIFIQKRILFRFWPIRPSLARAGLLCPAGRRVYAQPIRPEQPWRICQKVYFLRLCAFRQRLLLSLTSLPCGPRPVNFIPFPTPADLSHVAASPRRLRLPCAARPPASRCQSKSLLPCLDSPF
jgi:hypothetical protein